MKASQILRENVNCLMEARGWASNKRLIDASEGRLSNGTLGRIRGDGENTKLSQVEELAAVFGLTPSDMLSPGLAASVASPSLQAAVARIAHALSNDMPSEVREDIGELLEKLAKRRGGTPDMTAQLVSLLSAFELKGVVTTQLSAEVNDVRSTSRKSAEHASAPQTLGGVQLNRDGGEKWDTSNMGTPTDVARPRSGPSRQRKPGEKPGTATSKR